MGELPWANYALCKLALEAQAHPDWTVRRISMIAIRAEELAVERGADMVREADIIVALSECETALA